MCNQCNRIRPERKTPTTIMCAPPRAQQTRTTIGPSKPHERSHSGAAADTHTHITKDSTHVARMPLTPNRGRTTNTSRIRPTPALLPTPAAGARSCLQLAAKQIGHNRPREPPPCSLPPAATPTPPAAEPAMSQLMRTESCGALLGPCGGACAWAPVASRPLPQPLPLRASPATVRR